ncbi:hypothetical protein Ssi03_34330 [Sphaerisporangium siamense]|nr:hypothetical protein Ssi03_34330 [Sphaerisporangium siamense]
MAGYLAEQGGVSVSREKPDARVKSRDPPVVSVRGRDGTARGRGQRKVCVYTASITMTKVIITPV